MGLSACGARVLSGSSTRLPISFRGWRRNFQVSIRSRKTFHQLVTLPDAAIPLAEAALIMACEEYPQLELSPYLDLLDEIADTAQETISTSDSPMDTVAKINSVLFGSYSFRG